MLEPKGVLEPRKGVEDAPKGAEGAGLKGVAELPPKGADVPPPNGLEEVLELPPKGLAEAPVVVPPNGLGA